jgi:transcriptional regulator with XRE-family HTH domain
LEKIPGGKARNIVGRRIKSIRMACNPKISQEDLAGRLASQGVTLNQTQIAKTENGQRPIADFELRAIAKALRVSIQELFDK